jgi:hypothetical protein
MQKLHECHCLYKSRSRSRSIYKNHHENTSKSKIHYFCQVDHKLQSYSYRKRKEHSWLLSPYDMLGLHLKLLYCWNLYIALFRTTLNSDKPTSLYRSVSKNVYVLSNKCKWFSTHFSKWLLLIFLLHMMFLLIQKVDSMNPMHLVHYCMKHLCSSWPSIQHTCW